MVYGYLYRLHPETVDEKNTFRPNEGEANQLLKYVWRNDSLIMVMPKDEMIGMCRANGNWTSYAEATYKAVMGKGVDDDRSTNIFDTYRYALINAWTSARLHRCRRSSPPSRRTTLTRGEAPAACSSR